MRISDWSSDGCSSDLLGIGGPGDLVIHLRRSPVAMQAATANTAACRARMGAMGRVPGRSKRCPHEFERACEITRRRKATPRWSATGLGALSVARFPQGDVGSAVPVGVFELDQPGPDRSEEH